METTHAYHMNVALIERNDEITPGKNNGTCQEGGGVWTYMHRSCSFPRAGGMEPCFLIIIKHNHGLILTPLSKLTHPISLLDSITCRHPTSGPLYWAYHVPLIRTLDP